MISADLYLSDMDFLQYLPMTDCEECGEKSCATFALKLKRGLVRPEACPTLGGNRIKAFQLALQADRILPKVPALELPRPGPTGLVAINDPDEQAHVLISGNSEFTQEVLSAIMAFTISPFWLLFVDSRGDTVDMAMIYRSLQERKIRATFEEARLHQGKERTKVVLPGFASTLREPLEAQTGWKVGVGPVCAAELPLYFDSRWEFPPKENID
ncbi:MAG: hypothetical protein JSU72_00385 [Deltaproteobacteria bacterium]|nr:MAG: hypothetical protein JSU72_00385 [Deltaproteobacteria bacterium]